MISIIKKTLVLVSLICTCSLCIYGQEAECIRKFEKLAKKVDEHNQSNLSVLEQARRDGRNVTDAQLGELRSQVLEITKEAMALHEEFSEKGIVISQLPQGLKILSDLRFQAMSKAARFRKIWMEMRMLKIIEESEMDVAQKWSFFNMAIGDMELRHKDTQKRIKDCIAKIKAYKDEVERLIREEKEQNGEVPVGLHPETQAESMQTACDTTRESIIADSNTVSHLSKIFDAMSVEYGIAHEYTVDDPKGAEGLEQELNTLYREVYRGGEREILLLPHQK